jgi:hypothetical protein
VNAGMEKQFCTELNRSRSHGYVLCANVGGNWTRSNLTTQEMARQSREKRKTGYLAFGLGTA